MPKHGPPGDPHGFLEKYGGDFGELFNATEAARAGSQGADPDMLGLSPEQLVELNRYAQSGDVPITAALAAPYEALKGAEQATGLPVLSGPSRALRGLGLPVSVPDESTSPASLGNVQASLRGAGERLLRGFRRGQGSS